MVLPATRSFWVKAIVAQGHMRQVSSSDREVLLRLGVDELVVCRRVGVEIGILIDRVHVIALVVGQVGIEADIIEGKGDRPRVDARLRVVGPGYRGVVAEGRIPARPELKLVAARAELEGPREEGRDAAIGHVRIRAREVRD
jgi:hypothetical protein